MKRDANELGNILENSLETPELQAHNSLKKVTKKPWNSTFHGFLWWTRRDSNPRPLGCEPNALPTELRARLCLVWINLTHLDCAICWSAWARVMSPLLSQLSYRPIFNYFGDCGAHCFSNMPICLCYMTMQWNFYGNVNNLMEKNNAPQGSQKAIKYTELAGHLPCWSVLVYYSRKIRFVKRLLKIFFKSNDKVICQPKLK